MTTTYRTANILSMYRAGHSIKSIARTVGTDENGRRLKPEEARKIVELAIMEELRRGKENGGI